jgi:recombination protein RecA
MKIKIKEIEQLLKDGKKVKILSRNNEYYPVKEYIKKGILKTWQVILENNFSIKVAEKHIFFTNSGWVTTLNLLPTQTKILCEDNIYRTVKEVKYIGEYPIVDIMIDKEDYDEQCYFGNGMLNHNSGKSLLASHILSSTQKMGGLAVFIDTEAATSTDFMKIIGVDINTLVHYRNLDTVEQIFSKIEEIINYANKFKFITIVWDSVTATSDDEEMEGEFAASGYGMAKAKLMSKGFRKLARLLQKHNVALVCTAQTRTNIGVQFGEKNVSASAGKALEFYASLRLKVERNGWIKEKITLGDKDVEEIRGINVKVTTKKSRVGPGFREANFNVYFNRGIDDKDSWFDALLLRGGIERPTTQKYKITFDDGKSFEFKKAEWKNVIKENNLIEDVRKKLIDTYIMKWEKKDEYTEDDLDAMTPTNVEVVPDED